MISSFGSVASHLAMTTFCWLPPLIVVASASRAFVLTSRRAAQGADAAFSARWVSSPPRVSRVRMTPATLRDTEASMTRPCLRRSSGMNAIPAAMAARGLRFATDRPAIVTSPDW